MRYIGFETSSYSLIFNAWHDQSFAKDFLAMSNMRDGGTTVIGVEEKAGIFTPVGVSAANEKTYKIVCTG